MPVFHCFFGEVDILVNSASIFGSGKFEMSVADLALGLTRVVHQIDQRQRQCEFTVKQSDDIWMLAICRVPDGLQLTHNLAPDKNWTVNIMRMAKIRL